MIHRVSMQNSSPFVTTLAALVALGIGGCGRSSAAGPDAGVHRDDTREVAVAAAEPAPFPRTALLQGTLDADHAVTLSAQLDGTLTAVRGELGDRVRRGALLAQIDTTDARTRVAQAEVELATARADLARYTGLDPVEAVSQQAIATAHARVESATAAVALARNSVAHARVVAPWDAAVQRRLVERGAFVRTGTALFDLVSTGPLRLGLEVPELYFPDVREGTTVRLIPGQGGEPSFEAQVTRVAPAINAATRTFRIEATVDPHDGALRAGMFVVAVVSLGMSDDAVRVPRGAVFSVLGHDQVVRMVDGKAVPTEVELLGDHDGFAFVRNLAAGAVVVTRGGGLLAPGTSIRVGPAPGASPARGAAR